MSAKLSHDQRVLVLRMFAEGMGYADIKREIRDQFNINMACSSIQQTCLAKKYASLVEKLRNTYLAKVKEVPIANKRYRLEDAEKLRKKINGQIDKLKLETKADKQLFIQLSGELRRVNAEAREEMEKKPQLVQQAILNMGDMSDDQLFEQKEQLIARYRRLTSGDSERISQDSGGFESEDSE